MYKHYKIIASVLFALLFSLRIVFFASEHAGIEHDSGWYMGVAKNLALRGIYASYTNTQFDLQQTINSGVHQLPAIHDSEGFNYFYPGITVGPGWVIPQALCYKIFGEGWWQNRAFSLLAMFALITLAALVVLHMAGMTAFTIFALWIWLTPVMSFAYAYESFAEHVATLYLLVSILLFCKFPLKRSGIFLSGIFAGLAFQTKTLTVFIVAVYAVFYLWWFYKNFCKERLLAALLMAMGIVLPTFVYELYRFVYLTYSFSYDAYLANNQAAAITFSRGGSGIDNFHFDWNFIWKKLLFWEDIGVERSVLFWGVLLSCSGRLLFSLRLHELPAHFKFYLVTTSFILLQSFWFIVISPNGWFRHVWYAAFLGMMIFAMSFSALLTTLFKKRVFQYVAAALVLVGLSFGTQKFYLKFLFSKADVQYWNSHSFRFSRSLMGLPSHPFINLQEQMEVVSFIQKNLGDKDRIFYLNQYLSAELSPLVDKVFFSLQTYPQFRPSLGGRAVLVLNSYVHGMNSWRFTPSNFTEMVQNQLCQELLFNNNSYFLCSLKTPTHL
ncbi:MAG: hypothetical protein HQK50_04625 [Oligoflexia bacterium]|nr:hypothetical protein [Oligoflexia bacterium]